MLKSAHFKLRLKYPSDSKEFIEKRKIEIAHLVDEKIKIFQADKTGSRILLFAGVTAYIPKPDFLFYISIAEKDFTLKYRRLISREYQKVFDNKDIILQIIDTVEPGAITTDIECGVNIMGAFTEHFEDWVKSYETRKKEAILIHKAQIKSQEEVIVFVNGL